MSSVSQRLDLESSRAKLLGALEDATDITVIRNPGNMGDHLIHAGMHRLLGEIEYRSSPSPKCARSLTAERARPRSAARAPTMSLRRMLKKLMGWGRA